MRADSLLKAAPSVLDVNFVKFTSIVKIVYVSVLCPVCLYMRLSYCCYTHISPRGTIKGFFYQSGHERK